MASPNSFKRGSSLLERASPISSEVFASSTILSISFFPSSMAWSGSLPFWIPSSTPSITLWISSLTLSSAPELSTFSWAWSKSSSLGPGLFSVIWSITFLIWGVKREPVNKAAEITNAGILNTAKRNGSFAFFLFSNFSLASLLCLSIKRLDWSWNSTMVETFSWSSKSLSKRRAIFLSFGFLAKK